MHVLPSSQLLYSMHKLSALIIAITTAAIYSATAEPLKVYILTGQSNMEGHAQISTFPHIGMDPKTKSLSALMQDEQGKPRTAERVWISYLGSVKTKPKLIEGKLTAGFGAPVKGPKIGPEYTLGLTLEKRMTNPILLIKAAWGGQTLANNFRPPSAGPYKLNDWQIKSYTEKGVNFDEFNAKVAKTTGVKYRAMMAHVKDVLANIKRVYPDYDPKEGYEIAGFVWFQGFNDMVAKHTYPNRDEPGGYDAYSDVLAHFIRDVRKDLEAPKMPFVIGVMGIEGVYDLKNATPRQHKKQYFRDAMAAPANLPEFKGNVHAVLTEKFWDVELGKIDEKWELSKTKASALKQNKELSKEERDAQMKAYRNELFTPEELALRDMATSNAGFHYLGSAKIFGQIGAAFADVLLPAEKK